MSIVCHKCNVTLIEKSRFCPNCGAVLIEQPLETISSDYTNNFYQGQSNNFNKDTTQNENEDSNNIIYSEFIGKNQDYYIPKFNKINDTNKISWNWAAFFFGLPWLCYRKLYKEALIYFGAAMLITLIFPNGYVNISLLLGVINALFGNYFYKNYVTSNVAIYNTIQQNNEKRDFLRKKGGVNIISAIIFSVFYGFVFLFGLFNF